MKLKALQLRDDVRIPEMPFRLMQSDAFDMNFESGLVTIVRRGREDDGPYIVPLSCVLFMRPEKAAPKK